MNQRQTNLYRDLMALSNQEAFYFQDFTSGAHTYRIFNYRLASFTDFQQPGAMECRGVMFEIDKDGNPLELKALPMEKFFNLNENPMTIGLDLTEIDEILLKADGSLMSTYTHHYPDGSFELKLKSRGSITSEQCIAAMDWLRYNNLYNRLQEVNDDMGYTVNLEWCSPIHRIVIGYMSPHLKVLNARNRETGEYMTYAELVQNFGKENVIDRIQSTDPVAFVASIPEMLEDIEGYVVRLKSGQRVKIKTNKYLSLHHAKDSVNNPRRLFECILDEGVDDLRGMFYTDQVAIMLIDEMQQKVDHIYNFMVKEVEEFYDANKHLDRKDYAIKAQKEVSPMYFSRSMNKYLGKDPEYKSFLKGKYKELGFRDEKVIEEG